MPFWRPKNQATPEQIQARHEEQEESWNQLMQGGLLPSAEERLQRLAGASPPLFTADVSPAGLLMLQKAGCRPLGSVNGVSSYCIQWKSVERRKSGRMATTAGVFWTAQMLALSRMQEQARRLGADYVVGARLGRAKQVSEPAPNYGWVVGYTYWASGTAVRFDDEPPPERPYICDVTASELWALRQAGFQPRGYVLGNSVRQQIVENLWSTDERQQNQELPEYTQGISKATDDAIKHLQAECEKVGATGLVGAKMHREVYPCGTVTPDRLGLPDLIISTEASGTAIVERAGRQLPSIDYAQVMTG
ncbi:MAG TPA: hypothetical protein VFW40_00855 [Capsulimonadaceae bacterium]|nr:hypothetical protein [Capsulimonadaceae bacterium]